jgi:hypothetical protein
MVPLYLLTIFDGKHIPLDIEFDYGELLRLLVKLYDLYRPYFNQHQSSSTRDIFLSQFHRVHDDMATIYSCAQSRVLEGLVNPTSIDQGLFNSVEARLDDYTTNIESTTA